jgi:molecular chaperone GrpE (heat shock protein)
MTDDLVEKAKADTKKAMSDIGNKMAHAKADANADVEKIKANFGHDAAEKQGAYARADINADAEKVKADVENMRAHAKADAEKAKADIGKKMSDALK